MWNLKNKKKLKKQKQIYKYREQTVTREEGDGGMDKMGEGE